MSPANSLTVISFCYSKHVACLICTIFPLAENDVTIISAPRVACKARSDVSIRIHSLTWICCDEFGMFYLSLIIHRLNVIWLFDLHAKYFLNNFGKGYFPRKKFFTSESLKRHLLSSICMVWAIVRTNQFNGLVCGSTQEKNGEVKWSICVYTSPLWAAICSQPTATSFCNFGGFSDKSNAQNGVLQEGSSLFGCLKIACSHRRAKSSLTLLSTAVLALDKWNFGEYYKLWVCKSGEALAMLKIDIQVLRKQASWVWWIGGPNLIIVYFAGFITGMVWLH